jgi:hypothetical protein
MRCVVFVLAMLIFVGFECGYGWADEPQARLWVPHDIISGESYEGLVILDNAAKNGQIVILSTSDPTIIQIPQSTTVHPYSNHGFFHIKTLREGHAQVFAAVNGQIISADLFVYSSNRHPEGLRIVLATNLTKTETMVGYVLTIDAKGSPIPVTADTVVQLSATPMIQLEPTELEIKQGMHYARFIAKIKGSGKIYASSEDLAVGESTVTKIHDIVTIRVAVAPDIIMEGSMAYFFVWLEKDGKPYKPPYVMYAFVSSSNLKSIRFNENPQSNKFDSIHNIALVNGVGMGKLVSQDAGSSTITATIEGLGTAQTQVIVGPAALDENFHVLGSDNGDKKEEPNAALAWFYPQVTDSVAYGVVALYNINSTKTFVLANNTIGANRATPLPMDGRVITLGAEFGLNHPQILVMEKGKTTPYGTGSTHAVQFEVTGTNAGDYTVTVSGQGLEKSQASLKVSSPFEENYELKITPIPAIAGQKSDLAMISVVDDSGAMIDAQKMLGGPLRVSVSDDEQTETSISSLNSAVYSATIEGKTKLVLSAEGLLPLETVMSPSGVAASVRLDLPSYVHVSEPFPFLVHEIDSYGTPIKKIESPNISSTSGLDHAGKYMKINSVGSEDIAAITRSGADSRRIEAFANVFEISLVPTGVTNRVGEEFTIEVESDIDDFEIMVQSPFPYKKIGKYAYQITPDIEGIYNITFAAAKLGYLPSEKSFGVFAEKFVRIILKAVGSDSRELNVSQVFTLDNVTRNIVTPYKSVIKPQFVALSFPLEHIVGNIGYRLEHVVFEDQKITEGSIGNVFLNKDAEMVAHYTRMVKIEAQNAEGSGYYPFGQTVTLSAPPKEKLSIFVRDVFDHWEGIEGSSEVIVFVATNDVKAEAVFREDHTFLMLTMACVVSLVLYYKFVKKRGINIRFYVDKISSTLEALSESNLSKKIRSKIGVRQ